MAPLLLRESKAFARHQGEAALTICTGTRSAVARRRAAWQSGVMASSSSRNPMAGGFLLAVSLIVGVLVGVVRGQASVGFVAGLGVGVALLLAVWLIDRIRVGH